MLQPHKIKDVGRVLLLDESIHRNGRLFGGQPRDREELHQKRNYGVEAGVDWSEGVLLLSRMLLVRPDAIVVQEGDDEVALDLRFGVWGFGGLGF